MSHSRFHRFKVCTWTCMAKSLRQAYDYWQDQPDCSRLFRPVAGRIKSFWFSSFVYVEGAYRFASTPTHITSTRGTTTWAPLTHVDQSHQFGSELPALTGENASYKCACALISLGISFIHNQDSTEQPLPGVQDKPVGLTLSKASPHAAQ